MKKFLALITLLCASQWSHAERFTIQHPMICDDVEIVMKELREKYKESPIWTGKMSTQQDNLAWVLVNDETLSWTVIMTTDKVACVVTVGEGFRQKPLEARPKKGS